MSGSGRGGNSTGGHGEEAGHGKGHDHGAGQHHGAGRNHGIGQDQGAGHGTGHEHGHGHGGPALDGADAERFWEERYSAKDRVWSGRPNPVLAEYALPLTPGSALDLGCGEGGDAVWLAARGWRVTAADISATALKRAEAYAAESGVADQLRTERHDFAVSFPEGRYDLVSAQYLQTPMQFPKGEVLRRATDALAPGGLLLITDHGSVRPWSWDQGEEARFPTAEEIRDGIGLDPAVWESECPAEVEREVTGPDGERATATDAVVLIRRRRDA